MDLTNKIIPIPVSPFPITPAFPFITTPRKLIKIIRIFDRFALNFDELIRRFFFEKVGKRLDFYTFELAEV